MAEYKCKNHLNKYRCDFYNENHNNCEKCELAIKPKVEIDVELFNELIEQSKELCSSIMDEPSGCEGCWLWQGIFPQLEDKDEWVCPLKETLDKIKEQIN